MDQKTNLLGFVSLYPTMAEDGYMGAVLITDLKGIPQEFWCTHPVKPNTIQKPLYGDTLIPFIGVKLCAQPLLQSVRQKPSLIIVNKDYLLDVRTRDSVPVVYVRRAGDLLEVKTNDEGVSRERVRLDSTSGKFQPVMLVSNPDYGDDVRIAKGLLDEAFVYLDPLEPFERVATALQVLSKQDSRFQ